MSKTAFRYFFDFLDGQKKWLNSMAEQGYRLKKCGRMTYTFDDCNPNEYEYTIEFIGDKSYSKGKDYRGYLESLGFRTFTKNINLNFSYGKIKWRPYAKGMGQLLILEKKRDGKPFELHTDVRDKLDTYKTARRAYVWATILMFGLAAITFVPDSSSVSIPMTWVIRAVILFFGILFAIPTVKYSSLVNQLKEESKTFE